MVYQTQGQMVFPFLETLQERGGRAKPAEVYEALAERLGLPTEVRQETIPGGFRKWDRTVRWVQQQAKLKGLVSAPRKGLWHLTESGDAFLRNARPGVVILVYEVVDKDGGVVGSALWGEMQSAKGYIEDGSINLIMTSPPYPLQGQVPFFL